jgi:hypothetical protein
LEKYKILPNDGAQMTELKWFNCQVRIRNMFINLMSHIVLNFILNNDDI